MTDTKVYVGSKRPMKREWITAKYVHVSQDSTAHHCLKGGMTSKDYKDFFVPNGAVYLSTVGYGTGALLARGIEKVEAVRWNEELGLAQAMWVIKCNKMGPFIVASDLDGNCLFERENAQIAKNVKKPTRGQSLLY